MRWFMESWHIRFWSCQSVGVSAVCLWCLCSKPEGGGRIKRKQKLYIYFLIQPAFYCVHSSSFQRLGETEVPGEGEERHTCMLGRQRASKGKGEKTEKETKHDRGRRVIVRCLRAVNHGRKPDGLTLKRPAEWEVEWKWGDAASCSTQNALWFFQMKLWDWNKLTIDTRLVQVRWNTGKDESDVSMGSERWGV